MSLPQFSAEAALCPTRGVYRGTAAGSVAAGGDAAGGGATGRGGAATGDLLSMQAFAGASRLGGFAWPVIRCCRWVPSFGRFVCTSRQQRPWEDCRCESGIFGPIILCRPIGASQTIG